jgi:hypothetical protein
MDAEERSKEHVICRELITITLVAGISVKEVPFSMTVVPLVNPVPARLVILTTVPAVPAAGVIPVMTGPGLYTVKPCDSVPD